MAKISQRKFVKRQIINELKKLEYLITESKDIPKLYGGLKYHRTIKRLLPKAIELLKEKL